MTKLAPEWVRTSDPVIRSPVCYRWIMAPAHTLMWNTSHSYYIMNLSGFEPATHHGACTHRSNITDVATQYSYITLVLPLYLIYVD